MEKYLVKSNEEFANANIENVESVFINPLRKLASAIKALEIGNVTVDLLKDAIVNNGKVIRAMFAKESNVDNIPDKRLADIAESKSMEKLSAFDNALVAFRNPSFIFDGTSINNPKLLQWVDVSEDGCITLSEAAKTNLTNNVKEYIKTKVGKDLYDLQHKVAKELQLLNDELMKIRHTPGMDVSCDVKYATMFNFPWGLFEAKDTGDGWKIEPRVMNFDPEELDNDDWANDDED